MIDVMKYKKDLSGNYIKSAYLDIVMEYVTMYETYIEGYNSYYDQAIEEINFIQETLGQLLESKSIKDRVEALEQVRDTVTKKMQVLTAYVDRFLVYEYVLNRVENRYLLSEEERTKELETWNLDEFVRELVQFIFSTEDNTIVNERIHEVIEQLPVRMARTKYLEYVKNSLKLFQDSDCSSLDGYIYMLRTSAMIYNPEGMDVYFTEYDDTLQEFAQIDFTAMEESHFILVRERLLGVSSSIQDISDIYMVVQRIVNLLYTMALLDHEHEALLGESMIHQCREVLQQVQEAYLNDEGDFLQSSDLLLGLEGGMEHLYEERIRLETSFEDALVVEDSGYGVLKRCQKLMASSLFAPLEEEEVVKVTSEYIEESAKQLTDDLLEVMKRNQRPVNRAIMAQTLGKLPTFFKNANEVMDYVQHSLGQCSDEAELISCIKLLEAQMIG